MINHKIPCHNCPAHIFASDGTPCCFELAVVKIFILVSLISMASRQIKKVKTFKSRTSKVTCVRSGKRRKVDKFKNSSDGNTSSVTGKLVDESPLDSPSPVHSHVDTESFEERELSMASDK